jgi:hypothetical protein
MRQVQPNNLMARLNQLAAAALATSLSKHLNFVAKGASIQRSTELAGARVSRFSATEL